MRIGEILFEDQEDILKSFFSLTKSGGKFKSDKQRNFLLSKCNDGHGVFRLVQNLRFGEHGGASAKVDWAVYCDNEGVTKITKSTPARGESVYWERTQEYLDKAEAKKQSTYRAIIADHEERIRYTENNDLADLYAELRDAEDTIAKLNDPKNKEKFIEMGLFDEISEKYSNRISTTKQRINLVLSDIERMRKEQEECKAKLS